MVRSVAFVASLCAVLVVPIAAGNWPQWQNDLGDSTLSSPAISDGQIFIRTETALDAIGGRGRS